MDEQQWAQEQVAAPGTDGLGDWGVTPAGGAPDDSGVPPILDVSEQTEQAATAPADTEPDPTGWVRGVVVEALQADNRVDHYEDQGAEDGDPSEGSVFLTDRDGNNYEIRVSQFS